MTWSHVDNNKWPTEGLSFGADYNPEQWDRSVWREDMTLMREAGVNLVSLGIFSWGLLEVADGEYDWAWFDEIVDLLEENGIAIDLATPTAAPPGWLHHRHPEILPVEHDGLKHWPGARLGWCPSSPIFRKYSLRIVRALADRYGARDHVVMWHVSNELGGGNGHCYCDVSAAAFRRWLRDKYKNLEALNAAWNSAFWGHTYRDFEHVLPPRGNDSKNPSLVLDFDRFSSAELLKHYLAERAVLKEVTPGLPVTTNFMVGAEQDAADYPRWSPHMDILANDHYTRSSDPLPQQDVAFSGDRMCALTTHRRPWMLMEHSTSAVNWQPRNRAKRAGEAVRNSLSHVAHGADGILFFQWRASRGGAEQFHSAMVPHAGRDTAVFRAIKELGAHLRALAPVQGSRVPQARVAILFDDEAGWAFQKGVKPNNELTYGRSLRDWHRALWERNIKVEVISPWNDFSGYDTLIAANLFVVSDENAVRIAHFAESGGTLIVTANSGIVDTDNQVRLGGYPGAFREVLGAWSEEVHPLQVEERFTLDTGWTGTDWTEHVHADNADVLARYVGGPVDGVPAVTSRTFPSGGRAIYVSAGLDAGSVAALLRFVVPSIDEPDLPRDVEMLVRESDTEAFVFFINHSSADVSVAGTGVEMLTGTEIIDVLDVPAGAVRVLRRPRA
jgi:beta-galactosidase